MTALRRDSAYEKTWVYGSFLPQEQETGQIWGFQRSYKGQELIVLVNFTDQPVRTVQAYLIRKVLLDNYERTEKPEQGRNTIMLRPWQALVFESDGSDLI